MKENFDEIFENLTKLNEPILKQIYEDSKIEKKKRNFLLKKYILLPTILIFIIQIIYMFNQKIPNMALATFWTIAAVIIYVIILNKNTINYIRYKRKIKSNIIFKLISRFFDNVDYIPNKELSKNIYNEAGFNNYTKYGADDYIEGYLKEKYKILMANVETTIERTDSDGHSSTIITFLGIFAKINLTKSINNSIKICNYNYKEKNKEKIDLDSSKFEDIFDVTTDNNIKAMQLLTSDVMELLLKFSKFINNKFDISIIENNIYIRINNNVTFEANLDKDDIIDKKQIKQYYDIFNFIHNLSLYVIKWIEESYINE